MKVGDEAGKMLWGQMGWTKDSVYDAELVAVEDERSLRPWLYPRNTAKAVAKTRNIHVKLRNANEP